MFEAVHSKESKAQFLDIGYYNIFEQNPLTCSLANGVDLGRSIT